MSFDRYRDSIRHGGSQMIETLDADDYHKLNPQPDFEREFMQTANSVARSYGKRILEIFRADKIGAPFTVNLVESIEESFNSEDDSEEHYIPDMQDLLYSIVLYRIVEFRQMNGSDIRFLRKSLGLRAYEVSKPLSISREHFSRCENNNVPMSNSLETLIRVFMFSKISVRLGSGLAHRDMTLQSGINMIFDRMNSSRKFGRYEDYELNLKRRRVDKLLQSRSGFEKNFAWIKADLRSSI